MTDIKFRHNGNTINIQCNNGEKMKDIFEKYKNKTDIKGDIIYLYEGKKINSDLNYEEVIKVNNAIVTVIDNNLKNTKKNNLVLSKDVICPECGENIMINIDDSYKINLYGCKNGHKFDYLSLDDFLNTQYIDLSKIICDLCKSVKKSETNNNVFYTCKKCNINLCPICKIKHKEHKSIDHNKTNYTCSEHIDKYIKYCNDCKVNLCFSCCDSHKGHSLFEFAGNKNDNFEEFKIFNKKVNEYIDKHIKFFNDIKENLDKLYQILSNIYNIDNENLNYYKIKNLNQNISFPKVITDNILTNIYYQINSVDDMITLIYKNNSKLIKLFDNEFIQKNSQCKIQINGQISNLKEYIKSDDDYLILKLTNIHSITDAYSMFNKCSQLKAIPDISRWNTKNLTNLGHMFSECENLEYLPNLYNWDTSNITSMEYMFNGCSSLKNLNGISNWDTSKVTAMQGMFYGCSSLEEIDISGWDISNVTKMNNMFFNCSNLHSVKGFCDLKKNEKLEYYNIFEGCSKDLQIPNEFQNCTVF